MTERPNKNGHGDEILSMMREHDLCAVDTYFKPAKKTWQGKQRRCNATYIPKGNQKRPTKLDYLCVSNRWKSMVLDCKVRWGPAIHRFGQQFDHGFLSVKWRWRTKRTKKTRRSDFATMTDQSWPIFDEALRIKLQQRNEPRAKTSNRMEGEVTGETDTGDNELANVFANITECVYETIKEIVPEKKWLKKNGRVVSQATKQLFERRANEYKRSKPTREQRKAWNV